MSQDVVHFAVERAEKFGADYAEARMEEKARETYILRNGILDAIHCTIDSGLAIRVIVDNGMSFLSVNDLKKERIEDTAHMAVRIARGAKRKRAIILSEEKPTKAKWSISQKKKIDDVSPEEKISDLVEVDETFASPDVRLPGRIVVASTELEKKLIANSEGTEVQSFCPRVGLYYIVTAKVDGKTGQVFRRYGFSGGWEAIEEWNILSRVRRQIVALSKSLREAKKPPRGELDLVLSSMIAGLAAHESCGHPSEADRMLGREAAQAGKSFMKKELLGKKLGSDIVTIVDDPTLEHGYGYYEYDDEGVKARKRELMKNGIVNEFLMNRESAPMFEAKSNAAARAAGYDREPLVRMANTIVEPGDMTEEELVEDVRLGLLLIDYMEWNINDTRYHQKYVGQEAYLIEGGEVGRMVRNPTIEITTPTFWSSVTGVGKKVGIHAGLCGKGEPGQPLAVSFGGPTIRLSNIRVR